MYLKTAAPGHWIAQVCIVFQIPKKVIPTIFLSLTVSLPEHLAYVNWFSYVSRTRDSNHGMYGVSHLMQNGQQQASIFCFFFEILLLSACSHLYSLVCHLPWAWHGPHEVV
jgi:hypothetical protein